MERTIFGFILAYSKRDQIVLLIVTLISFPFLYFSLDLPKIIINDAISGGDHVREFLGGQFGQLEYLFLLCGIFLGLVLFNGVFKYFINVYRGRMAELLLRRIRYILYSRVLRFPLPHFSKLSQGEIVSIITAEAEPLGGFFGEAYSLPVYQGGVLITILGFIAIQDPYMGIAAIAFYPLQMWLIPKLQVHVNNLAKERVMNIRKVSESIGESVEGVQEVHANDTSQYELAGLSELLGRNFDIRLNIYKKKFFIKFLNNFIAQVTPFFFYSIGGYLVIAGDLSFGALVASLAAYKDLASPWKELLGWYQRKEDSRIKYDQLVERFHPEGLMEESLQHGEPEGIPDFKGEPVTTANLGWQDDGGVKAVDGVGLHISPGEKVLIIGGGGSGKEHLAQMLARILAPTAGSIRMGDNNMALLHESVTGRRFGYA
ncbi:MAG: ABC transporter ATP-binding protein, partial [Planctomycetes bacterium]|nr:ABC transporter ATP-binding protein [Planctomycetota bacterium]